MNIYHVAIIDYILYVLIVVIVYVCDVRFYFKLTDRELYLFVVWFLGEIGRGEALFLAWTFVVGEEKLYLADL